MHLKVDMQIDHDKLSRKQMIMSWKQCMMVIVALGGQKAGIFESITNEFLPRDAMLSMVYAVVMCPSVCVCVCVRNTPVLYQNG